MSFPANELLPDPYPVRQVHLTQGFSARPPGSKSLTNRALIMAALTGEAVTLVNPLTSEDTEVAKDALRALGVQIKELDSGDWLVDGSGLTAPAEPPTLYLGNAGTAMRFLTAVLCARGIACTLDGSPRMRERPMHDLIQALQDLGGDVTSQFDNGCPPIVIGPGGLRGGETTMSGQVSSQFFSALMLAAPLAKQDVVIHIKDELLSRPYVEMTAKLLYESFNFQLVVDLKTIKVAGHQSLNLSKKSIPIETDASAATYPLGLAVLQRAPKCHVDGIRLPTWGADSQNLQGDINFVHFLRSLGYEPPILSGGPLEIYLKTNECKPLTANLQEIPDAAMTLVTLLAVVPGHSSLTGLRNLAFKECDRLSALETELGRLGCDIKVRPDRDGFEINGVDSSNLKMPTDGPLRTYKDHRMAMCLAILGTIVPGGVEIEDPRCVEKTYPTFWRDLADWIKQGE